MFVFLSYTEGGIGPERRPAPPKNTESDRARGLSGYIYGVCRTIGRDTG